MLATDVPGSITIEEQFPARPESLAALHTFLAGFWLEVEHARPTPADTVWKLQFDTALVEVVTNVIAHGHDAAPCDAVVHLDLCVHNDRVEAHIRDRGVPFPGTLDQPDATAMPDLDAERGRGLPIAQAALDSITYSRDDTGENCWLLVKHF